MLLGWSVMHVQRTKCEKWERRQSVRITLKEFANASAFPNRTEREDMVVYQDDHALYLLRYALLLSRTHRSRRGLHGVEAAFTLSSPFSRQAPSSFSLTPITTFAV